METPVETTPSPTPPFDSAPDAAGATVAESQPTASSSPPEPPSIKAQAEVDMGFLDNLMNSSKTRQRRRNVADALLPNENIDHSADILDTDEENATSRLAAQGRLRIMRRERAKEAARQELAEEALVVSRRPALRREPEPPLVDPALFDAIMEHNTKKAPEKRRVSSSSSSSSSSSVSSRSSRSSRHSRHSRSSGSQARRERRRSSSSSASSAYSRHSSRSDRVSHGGPPQSSGRPRRKTADEERIEKAQAVSRIKQLAGRNVTCTLPSPKDVDWMTLSLDTLLNAKAAMEVMYERRGKILKARAAFMLCNKGIVYGATSHPGPEWAKIYRLKGFDAMIASEIDEFDDDLEKIYDTLLGGDGPQNPFISLLLIQGAMMTNYIVRNDASKIGTDAAAASKTVDAIPMHVHDPGKGPQKQGAMGHVAGVLPSLVSTFSNNQGTDVAAGIEKIIANAAAQKQTTPQAPPQPRPSTRLGRRSYTFDESAPNPAPDTDAGSGLTWGSAQATYEQPPQQLPDDQRDHHIRSIQTTVNRLESQLDARASTLAATTDENEKLRHMLDEALNGTGTQAPSQPSTVDSGRPLPQRQSGSSYVEEVQDSINVNVPPPRATRTR